MNKFSRGKPQQLHTIRPQRIPHLSSRFVELFTELTFRLLLIELLQCRLRSKRIQEIAIQRQPHSTVHIAVILLLCRDKTIERFQHLRSKDYSAGVNIHAIMGIDRTSFLQHLNCLLMQETGNIAIVAAKENAMVFASLHIFLEGNSSSAIAGIINLKRIEQQQHIAGKQQHTASDPGRHRCHRDHELIKQRRALTVRQFMGNRGE